ncbi:MAG: type IV pilus modification PilV family protein [Planctomycetota bacterium]|jgi:hypothetical protein
MCEGSRHPHRYALTLIEAVMSMVIVSGMLVAALNTYGAQKLADHKGQTQVTGTLLAEQMVAEILKMQYEEPEDTPTWGKETGELDGTSAAFDDIDDYENWIATPPQERDGTVMTGLTDWERKVKLFRPHPENLDTDANAETGIKVFRVTVKYNGLAVTRIMAMKCGTSPF